MDSRDPFVAQVAPRLTTGRKWTPSVASKRATAALKHRDIVGQVQQGRSGLGLGARTPAWNKAPLYQRRKLVAEEIRRQEEATQGRWMNWEEVEKREIYWEDLWEMETFRASLTIKAAYDVLSSPKNLNQ